MPKKAAAPPPEQDVEVDAPPPEPPLPTGRINVKVASLSFATKSMGDNSGGVALLWARVLCSPCSERWVQSTDFAQKLWTNNESSDADEEAPKSFSFWPPTSPGGIDGESSGDVETEGKEGAATGPSSWAWTDVVRGIADSVAMASAEDPLQAAAAWELVLSEGSNEDVTTVNMSYPSHPSGIPPTRSDPIPLSEDHMNALLNSVISVEVYRGPDRSPETDKLVGTAIFGSESWVDGALVGSQNSVAAVLVSPEGVTATLPVRPAENPAGGGGEEEDVDEGKAGDHHPEFAGTCEVTITITADEALLAYTRGSRVFTVLTTGVQHAPMEWEGNDAAAEGGDADTSSFILRSSLPGQPYGPKVFRLGGGKRRSLKGRANGAGAEGEKNGDVETKAEGKESAENEDGGVTTVLAWAPEESGAAADEPVVISRVYVNAERVTEMVSEDAEIGDFWSMDMIRDGSELEPPKAEEGVSAEEAAAAAAMWQLPRNSRFLIDIAPLMEHLINPGSASWSGKLPVKDAAPEPPKDSADDDFVADEDAPAPPPPPCIFCYGQFDRPLVPAPTKPPEPELMARDIIPLRPDPAKKPPPLAAKLFRDEVKATVKDLAAEISQLFGDNLSANGEAPDARRKRFLYHLNSSGKYGAFREKLKHAVGRLVKERFAEQSELDDGTLRDKFISDLYIHLMEETLVVINAMSMEAKGVPLPSENAPAEKSKTDLLLRSAAGDTSAMLQRLLALAAEAEANGNNRIAEERYESCVAASEEAAAKNFSRKVEGGGAAPWMGYAYFCCRLENFAKATSCCEEAVAVNDPPSPDALLLLAALHLAKGNSEEALALLRTLAEAADSNSTTTYALMSMCHTMRPKETKKAKKALLQATANGATDTEVFADLAVFLSRVHLTELSTIALRLAMGASISSTISSQGASSKESPEDVEADDFIWGAEDVPRKLRLKMSWLNAANTYFNGSIVEAQRLAVRSIQQGEACGEGWLIKGHCLWAQGDVDGAIQAYQAALPRLEMSAAEDAPQEIGLYALYILLAQAYIKKGGDACLKAAKEVSLRASKSLPSASTWLYAGIAALRLGELDEAEEALSEANILDNMNPEVWGQLTLLCLRTVPERRAEADQSFAQAVKLNLENAETLAAIGVAYKMSGRLQPAESALRRALAVRENPGLQITLGEALASQNRHEDALEVYELVLGSSEANESDKRLAAKGAKASRASLGGMKK